MAAPTEEELIAALGKHHHHAEQTDNEKPATKTKSADMFDMSKVETAKTTWRSGLRVELPITKLSKATTMKDGKYDPPMFATTVSTALQVSAGQASGAARQIRNPDPSNCQAASRCQAMGAAGTRTPTKLERQGESIQENRVQGSHERGFTSDDGDQVFGRPRYRSQDCTNPSSVKTASTCLSVRGPG